MMDVQHVVENCPVSCGRIDDMEEHYVLSGKNDCLVTSLCCMVGYELLLSKIRYSDIYGLATIFVVCYAKILAHIWS